MLPRILFGAAATLLVASGASAATFVSNSGDVDAHYALKFHNNSAPTGKTVTLQTHPGPPEYDIDLTANPSALGGSLNPAGNGDGFAQVIGPFDALLIDPQDPLLGFTDISFKLEPYDFSGGYTFYADFVVTFLNDPAQSFLNKAIGSNGKVNINAEGDELITSLTIKSLLAVPNSPQQDAAAYDFGAIKQISINGAVSAVPEPATWAMMITGFGLAGAALRRRRIAVTA